MSTNYSLVSRRQEAQRVEVSRSIPYSIGYRAVLTQRSRKYAGPHEENRGNKGRRIGGFLDLSL